MHVYTNDLSWVALQGKYMSDPPPYSSPRHFSGALQTSASLEIAFNSSLTKYTSDVAVAAQLALAIFQ